MSERMTSATAPGCGGIAESGRRSREEMVAEFRRYYERQRDEALKALSTPDEAIVVETYLGPWAMRNREIVTTAEPQEDTMPAPDPHGQARGAVGS